MIIIEDLYFPGLGLIGFSTILYTFIYLCIYAPIKKSRENAKRRRLEAEREKEHLLEKELESLFDRGVEHLKTQYDIEHSWYEWYCYNEARKKLLNDVYLKLLHYLYDRNFKAYYDLLSTNPFNLPDFHISDISDIAYTK